MIASILLTAVPWAVFSVAAGLLLWRISKVLRKGGFSNSRGTEEFRQSLERIWAQSPTSM